MNITQLIEELEALKEKHGDLYVFLDRETTEEINEVKAYGRPYYNLIGELRHDPLAVWIS